METGEKKIKQSILSIALILLLCGYFSAQRLSDSSQLKNAEQENNIPHHSIDNTMQQDETLNENSELEETGDLILKLENIHNPFQTPVASLNPVAFQEIE